jgi:hypothetical protein
MKRIIYTLLLLYGSLTVSSQVTSHYFENKDAFAGYPFLKLQAVASVGASLQQNSPNPFSQSTVIRYTLPQTDKPAQLVVSGTDGRIVRQIPLPSGEAGSITIEGGNLPAGIYYYSLYVGSSLVDTKKMILTK